MLYDAYRRGAVRILVTGGRTATEAAPALGIGLGSPKRARIALAVIGPTPGTVRVGGGIRGVLELHKAVENVEQFSEVFRA